MRREMPTMQRAKPSSQKAAAGVVHRAFNSAPTNPRSTCACGGTCPRCAQKPLQAKLAVSQPGDASEREADRIADAMLHKPQTNTVTDTTSFQVMRRAESAGAMSATPGVVQDALQETGQPLDATTREFFEPRLNHDLSAVRVHVGADADASARAVNAHAYTVGHDVVFRDGRYAPSTASGRHLLAHELTHVVQQSAAAQPSLQRDDAGGGSSSFSEMVDSVSTNTGSPGVWDGRVTRTERNRAGDTIHTGRAPVHYDENTCRVTVPMTVSFRNATLADTRICRPHWDQPAPTTAPPSVSSTRLREVANQYLRALNTDLNGWYKVRFDGCDNNRCHGRDMPIEVQATEVASGGDYEVAIANREGRSCVDNTNYQSGASSGLVVLYSNGFNSGTMAHEGGHMILGHGDEYRETETPNPSLDDRVREGDFSRMASHSSFGRFTLMHERHFAFVPAFLNHVRPGCNARLVAVDRLWSPDFRINVSGGYAGFPRIGGGLDSGAFLDIGVELGVPLNRLRQWELIVGLHGRILIDLENDARLALLLGIRLGLERNLTPASGGLTLGAFGEMGISQFDPNADTSLEAGAYAEGGAYLSYIGRAGLGLRLEGALGNIWSSTGRIGPTMPALIEPENMEYVRAGIGLVGRF